MPAGLDWLQCEDLFSQNSQWAASKRRRKVTAISVKKPDNRLNCEKLPDERQKISLGILLR
jgi:hypothetical protein